MLKDYKELTESFEKTEIDARSFDHLDHVGVAYEILGKYDFLHATVKYADCINIIAAKVGVTDKFNTTITLAFMSVIAERRQTVLHNGIADFLEKNPDLLSVDFIRRWYSPSRFSSDLARTVFLMPDMAA